MKIFCLTPVRHSQNENISNTILPIFSVLLILLILLVLPIFTSCTSCSSKDKFDFTSAQDAIAAYKVYLSDLRQVKTTNTDNFIVQLKEWKEINDTIYRYLRKDSVFKKEPQVASAFFATHDSVRNEMMRLTETWRYGYDDVLSIKEKSSSFVNDSDLQAAVKDAQSFFDGLSDNSVHQSDKGTILSQYRELLAHAKEKGVSCKDDMLQFIKEEDLLFRSFLTHLHEMGDEPIADITHDTENICRRVFLAAKDGKIPARDAVVYMSMRTVRRLLQNSSVCVDGFTKLDTNATAQANAYIWMIIQPFISIDQFSIATMTSQDRKSFEHIVSQLPKSARFAKTFDINQQTLNYLLPQQLLKLYVLYL